MTINSVERMRGSRARTRKKYYLKFCDIIRNNFASHLWSISLSLSLQYVSAFFVAFVVRVTCYEVFTCCRGAPSFFFAAFFSWVTCANCHMNKHSRLMHYLWKLQMLWHRRRSIWIKAAEYSVMWIDFKQVPMAQSNFNRNTLARPHYVNLSNVELKANKRCECESIFFAVHDQILTHVFWIKVDVRRKMKVTFQFSSNHFRFHAMYIDVHCSSFGKFLWHLASVGCVAKMCFDIVYRHQRTLLMPDDCSISIGDFIEQQQLLPTPQSPLSQHQRCAPSNKQTTQM